MKPFVELDTVQLQKAHPECGLAAGALGTVVLIHAEGEAYEVEFIGLDGHTQAVLTLPAAKGKYCQEMPDHLYACLGSGERDCSLGARWQLLRSPASTF